MMLKSENKINELNQAISDDIQLISRLDKRLFNPTTLIHELASLRQKIDDELLPSLQILANLQASSEQSSHPVFGNKTDGCSANTLFDYLEFINFVQFKPEISNHR